MTSFDRLSNKEFANAIYHLKSHRTVEQEYFAAAHLSLIVRGEKQAELRGELEEHPYEDDVFTESVVQCSKQGGKETLLDKRYRKLIKKKAVLYVNTARKH